MVELMVVLAIVGILVALAVPSWMGYVERSRRSDAMSSLIFLQLEQEKWRSSDTDYATLAEIGMPASPGNSTDGYYTISITANTAGTYAAQAQPVGAQSEDHCGVFAVNQNGPIYTGFADQKCWGH